MDDDRLFTYPPRLALGPEDRELLYFLRDRLLARAARHELALGGAEELVLLHRRLDEIACEEGPPDGISHDDALTWLRRQAQMLEAKKP